MKNVYVVGTCDTKFKELNYMKEEITRAGVNAVLVDVATKGHDNPVDVKNEEVARHHPTRKNLLQNNDGRGDAVTAMAEAFLHYLKSRNDLGGVISAGGSGNTALVTKAMRSLPVGLPKMMVSTVAAGNVAPYVGASDIAMMYSVTDIAGINKISHTILGNAAHAMAGMVKHEISTFKEDKPSLGITMFGVTTPCVNKLREKLEAQYEALVFHATGTGGQSMEKLIDSGMIKHVIDVTTTEVADLHMGGVMSAGEDRMGAIIRNKIPYLGSVGALDMVNFGHIDTVPEHYKNRQLYKHNEQVTLMRTTPEENQKMGKWIANKLNQMEAPVRFLIPEKGVSMIDVDGQPFHNPEADQALFDAIRNNVQETEKRKVISLPYAVNDDAFVDALVEHFHALHI